MSDEGLQHFPMILFWQLIGSTVRGMSDWAMACMTEVLDSWQRQGLFPPHHCAHTLGQTHPAI